jgi:hypothetical protein
MKQKKFYFSFAASLMLALTGLTSCTLDDNPIIEPDEPEYVEPEFEPGDDAAYFINYSKMEADEYPYYRMGEPEGSSFNVVNKTLVITNEKEQANNWDLQPFIIDWFNIKQGGDYTVRITYNSTAAGTAWLSFGTWGANLANYNVPIEETADYKTLEVKFENVSISTSGNDAHVLFQMGKLVGTVKIKMVEIIEVAPEPDPEPEQIDGYKVVFFNWGKADQDKYSVKYFKNYTAPKAADGAIVVESLDPEKVYTEYDNAGADAKLAQNWDTQFLISLPEPLAKGTKAKLVMKVKADKAANAETQCHKVIPAPGAIEGKNGYDGSYIFYSLMGNISFTTEWTTVEKDFTVPDQGDGMQSICLNLEVLREVNKYYFDDVTVYVEKEWEPEAEEGWDILTFDSGKGGADGSKFQMKYFKNYVAAKAADGAVVAESLDPEKTYTQYDNAGADAKVAQNWDTQFLIGLPKAVAKGTKMKLQMLVKADKATNGESQAHGVLPKVGAIEGKDGYNGTYLHYQLLGNVPFTTEWTPFETEFTVPDQGDGMGSICLNLEVLREVNKYYFKEIVVRVAK